MKSLFINGVEQFRIEDNNYYVGNDICLEKVNKEKFIDAKNTSNNSSGFYHVFKEKSSKYSQGYIWIYHFTDDDGKKKKIRRVNLHDLKEEVLSRGMEWRIVNEELARLNL